MRNRGLRYLNFNQTSMASINERDVKHTKSKVLAKSIHNLQNTINDISKPLKKQTPKPIETCCVCLDEIKEKKDRNFIPN